MGINYSANHKIFDRFPPVSVYRQGEKNKEFYMYVHYFKQNLLRGRTESVPSISDIINLNYGHYEKYAEKLVIKSELFKDGLYKRRNYFSLAVLHRLAGKWTRKEGLAIPEINLRHKGGA